MSRNFISRKTQILCSQTDLLCSTLKMLKDQSDSGHGTAGRIWNSLIDGISAEIPEEVFADEAECYQCTDEQEGGNGQAFKKILDKAVLKKAQGSSGTKYERNCTQVLKKVSAGEGVETIDGKVVVPASFKKINAKVTEDEQHEKEIDNLLLHLVDMLRVAVERTELSYWDWKEEDDALKLDIATFNNTLKTSLNLVKNVHSSLTERSLMEATVNFTVNETADVFELMKNSVLALEAVRPVNPVSSAASSYDDCSDDDDSEDIVCNDDDQENEVHVDQNVATEQEKAKASSKSKETGKTPVDCKNHVCSSHSSHTGYGYASKYEIPKPGTPLYETFIVRHAKKSTKKTIKAIRNPPCDHTGYVFPTAHYRDWKRDGFRCMCGQRFRFLNAMDRHIFIQQELRMLYCDECNYKTSRKCCMEKHKKSCHEKAKMLRACRRLYQCMFGCDQLLKSKKELYDHQKKTDRQCLYRNAGKLPAKYLPPKASSFILGMKNTFENTQVALTVDMFDKILTAAMSDAMRIKKAGMNWEEIKISLAFKGEDGVWMKIENDKEQLNE